MRYFIAVFVLLVLASGCREKTGLEKEVMDIHDEVMPRLGELNKDRKNLKKLLNSVTEDSIKKELRTAIVALEAADEGMMLWMSEWSVPDSEPQRTEYLKNEKVRIQKVKNDMLSSMEVAKELYKKYKE